MDNEHHHHHPPPPILSLSFHSLPPSQDCLKHPFPPSLCFRLIEVCLELSFFRSACASVANVNAPSFLFPLHSLHTGRPCIHSSHTSHSLCIPLRLYSLGRRPRSPSPPPSCLSAVSLVPSANRLPLSLAAATAARPPLCAAADLRRGARRPPCVTRSSTPLLTLLTRDEDHATLCDPLAVHVAGASVCASPASHSPSPAALNINPIPPDDQLNGAQVLK